MAATARDATLSEESKNSSTRSKGPEDELSVIKEEQCGVRLAARSQSGNTTPASAVFAHSVIRIMYKPLHDLLTVVDEVLDDVFAAGLHGVMQQRAAVSVLQQEVLPLLVELLELHNKYSDLFQSAHAQ